MKRDGGGRVNWLRAGAALAAFLAVLGFGQQAAQPSLSSAPNASAVAPEKSTPPDKVVMKVGNQQVTAGDFEIVIQSLPAQAQQALAARGLRELGDRYATMLALSQKAESEHLDQSAQFQKRMAMQRMQTLAEAEYQNLSSQVKVAPEDVNHYYSTHASEFDQVEIRQISVRKRAAGAKPGAPGLDAQEAHARADQVRKALSSGTDAQKVADQFKVSKDVTIDLRARPVSRAQMPADLQSKIFNLKDGEVSEPIENAQGIYLVQVVRHGKVDLQDASQEIETRLQNEKLNALVSDVKTKAGITMDPGYFSTASPAPGLPAVGAPAGSPPSGPKSPK